MKYIGMMSDDALHNAISITCEYCNPCNATKEVNNRMLNHLDKLLAEQSYRLITTRIKADHD
jgi:hypothetical protein